MSGSNYRTVRELCSRVGAFGCRILCTSIAEKASNAKMLNSQLNNAVRIISGSVRSTPLVIDFLHLTSSYLTWNVQVSGLYIDEKVWQNKHKS